jgi:hypothetical protein
MSLLVGALSCGLRRTQKGLKKTFSAWPQGQGCGRLKKRTPIRLEGIKRYSSSASLFFYRACAGFAWWVSQRTPAGQIWVVGPVVVGHPRYARWGRAIAARALFPNPPGPPPKPPAGCAGEPCRGRSWQGSHEHARATRGTRCRGLPEHPSAPGFKQSSIFF